MIRSPSVPSPSRSDIVLHVTVATVMGYSVLAFATNGIAQEGTRNGALLGGAAGAVIGGVIGNNHHDQTAEGALIGGAVGAVTGGLIGHHRDQAVAQQQQQQYYGGSPYRSQPYNNRGYGYPVSQTRNPYRVSSAPRPMVAGPGQPTIIYQAPVVTRNGFNRFPTRPIPTQVRQPVLLSDVIHMTRSGVSDAVIVSRIQANGVAVQPTVDDVVALSQEGVSDYVITALQNVGTAEVIVEPNAGNSSSAPMDAEIRKGELMPVPPMRSQRRGF